ncbi:MAG: thiamine phosphate synthase [Methylobacteriaceae bacterium]|jgi:thiamine-phosphate pyrophosphorylase|nr:thiamine phosphate synthase [Methylobacteriaceae bacterium]
MKPVVDYSLYLILDPDACLGRDPLEIALETVAGGVTLVQLRAPLWKKRRTYELATALKAALTPRGVPLIINDDVDVAVAAKAAGAHVGQKDLPPQAARALLGDDAILGLSVSFPEHLEAALALPPGTIDYIGSGPAFATPSKADANPVIGPQAVIDFAGRSPVPVVAIGGIDAERAVAFHRTKVAGVCAISALCAAPDPAAAARAMKRAFSG